jgi:hypothetical protein
MAVDAFNESAVDDESTSGMLVRHLAHYFYCRGTIDHCTACEVVGAFC